MTTDKADATTAADQIRARLGWARETEESA